MILEVGEDGVLCIAAISLGEMWSSSSDARRIIFLLF